MARGDVYKTIAMKSLKQSRGTLLVEAIVAVSLITIVFLAAMQVTATSLEVSTRSLTTMQGAFLLEEGSEAVRTIRDTSWATFSGYSTSSTYYLSWGSGAWTLSTTPNTVDSFFTRTITFARVYRDANDDITGTGGTLDNGTRKVTVTVSWNAGMGPISKTLTFYLSNILN